MVFGAQVLLFRPVNWFDLTYLPSVRFMLRNKNRTILEINGLGNRKCKYQSILWSNARSTFWSKMRSVQEVKGLDIHHGNNDQAILWSNNRSIRFPFWRSNVRFFRWSNNLLKWLPNDQSETRLALWYNLDLFNMNHLMVLCFEIVSANKALDQLLSAFFL